MGLRHTGPGAAAVDLVWCKKGQRVSSLVDWDRYLRWNEAIATVVFSRDSAGRPVYLDLEDEVLAAIRDVAEPNAAAAAPSLVEAVKKTLYLRGGSFHVFAGHLRQLRSWHHGTMLGSTPNTRTPRDAQPCCRNHA